MLQTIHDRLKGIFAITILVALGVVFVFWGVDVSVGTFTRARGIEVNGQEIAVEEVQRAYRDELSRLEAAFGAAGVPDEMRTALQTRVLEQAIRSELIRQRARELKFETSDQQVLEAISMIPAFQVDGKFSRDAYIAALRSIGLAVDQFEAGQRDYVLSRQVDRGLFSSAFVLPAELERRIALARETRELSWVNVPAAGFIAAVQLDEAAIQAYYEAHQSEYMTAEWATVDYIELDIEVLAAAVTIDESRLREYYEENRERYTTAGRRQARHILIASGDDPAADEARARAAYERARNGEDFGALARELSDDTGSKESGGDLGMAERGDFVAAFGDAVWSMSPGEIRGPVKTEFGWHVIKLEAASPEISKSFEEVRAELEPELRRAEVEKAFGDAQEELDRLSFEAAGNLQQVATQMNRPLSRVPRFTRSGSPELGSSRALIEAVFAPDVLAGRELRTVELAPGRVVAIGVTAHQAAAARPLDEVREPVTNAARLAGAQELATARARALLAELEGGSDWQAATRAWQKPAPAATHLPRPVRRDDMTVPAEIRTAAFRAPAPQGKARYGLAELGTGDAVVWSVGAVRSGSLAELSPEEQKLERDQAHQFAAQADIAAYFELMRAGAEVDVNPQLFE